MEICKKISLGGKFTTSLLCTAYFYDFSCVGGMCGWMDLDHQGMKFTINLEKLILRQTITNIFTNVWKLVFVIGSYFHRKLSPESSLRNKTHPSASA
jgi:hypothetical protein